MKQYKKKIHLLNDTIDDKLSFESSFTRIQRHKLHDRKLVSQPPMPRHK